MADAQLDMFEPDRSGAFEPQGEVYSEVLGEIPIDLPNEAWISIERDTPVKVYSLGFQPAKSIPEIPRWFLRKYGDEVTSVLEPFAGSGTTLIECIRQGVSVSWVDYNPLARLICRVKTTHISVTALQEVGSQILLSVRKRGVPSITTSFANRDFWFQNDVQVALENLKAEIEQAPAVFKDSLLLAYSLTVRKTSNMNEGMILAATRRNVKDVPIYSTEDVYNYFGMYFSKTLDALKEWLPMLQVSLSKSSCLPIDDTKDLDSQQFRVDAIVTSPPYINAMDYVWASKFELHWLGLVKDDDDRLRLYSKEIGTERLSLEDRRQLGKTGIKELDDIIKSIYEGSEYKATGEQNKLRSRVTYQYFIDMREHFQKCSALLRDGGYYCFTIGDRSKICGVDIPVADLLTALATQAGFEVAFRFHLLLKNRRLNVPRNVDWAGTIKHDTTVVLRKRSAPQKQ